MGFLPKHWLNGALIAPATRFQKASRPESAQGFVPIAKRWVVDRSAGAGALHGLSARAPPFFRRIVKDYDYTLSSSASWLYLANIQIMLQRI
ncbi:hypothetical protein [Spirosoma jeollabukense]